MFSYCLILSADISLFPAALLLFISLVPWSKDHFMYSNHFLASHLFLLLIYRLLTLIYHLSLILLQDHLIFLEIEYLWLEIITT